MTKASSLIRAGLLASLILLACASAQADIYFVQDFKFDRFGANNPVLLLDQGSFAGSPGGLHSWAFSNQAQPTSGDVKVYRAGVLVQVYHFDSSGVGYLDVYTDSGHGGSGFLSSFSANVVTLNVANNTGTNLVVYYPTTSGQPGYGVTSYYSSYWGTTVHYTNESYTFVADPPAISSTTTLTSSQNPSLSGGAATFTATVTGSGGTPTGTVTFMDGTTALGTGTLNGSGVAYFGTGALAAGPAHSITAVYSADVNFNASTSSVLSQTVSGPNNITINNPSFEADVKGDGQSTAQSITSWIGSGNYYGVINPNGNAYAWATDANSPGYGNLALAIGAYVDSAGIASGTNVAYLTSGAVTISQVLTGNSLSANTTYVLSGAIGSPNNTGTDLGASVVVGASLYAGTTLLATNSLTHPGVDHFGFWMLSYTAPATGVPSGDLKIMLGRTSGNGEVDFDNIKLYSGLGRSEERRVG